MRVIEIGGYGGPEQLRDAARPEPIPAPGAVRVRVRATSFNPIDPKRASGALRALFPLEFPFVPGGDFAGTVDAVGAGVTHLAVGDEVWGNSSAGGSYAERIAIEADKVGRMPVELSHVEAASLALVGQTALQAIDRASLGRGQVVLIHGAGGAVGRVAVSVARALGAVVFATASATDAARVAADGAARVIDRAERIEDAVERVDAVLDGVGGDVQARSWSVLRRGGILVALSQPPDEAEAARTGVRTAMVYTGSSTGCLDRLRALVEAGVVSARVDRVRPLHEAGDAWRARAAGGEKGKTVFVVD